MDVTRGKTITVDVDYKRRFAKKKKKEVIKSKCAKKAKHFAFKMKNL